MASLKKNIIYSAVLTVSGYLFPLLTFPYVTRVLGVNNIGLCNFVDSVVQYFIIFSMMGAMTVGIREVAKTKNNHALLSKTFSSILSLNLLFTIVAVLFLCIFVYSLPLFQEHSELYYIGAAKIIANSLLIEWLYKGLENFRYITIRAVIVRGLYVISVFFFVRNSSDYQIYFFLTTAMFVINAAVNIIHARKYVKFNIKDINLRPYFKPYVVLGIYMVLTNFYTTFNVMYLGIVSDEVQVGYYTTATKLFTIITSLFYAFTGVMMPRMSALLAEDKIEQFKNLITKSVEVLLAIAMPIIVITEICAPQIIQIIAGEGYEGAVTPMRIVMPLMLIIGYEQIAVLQILTPLKKDSAILTNATIGAIVAILSNLLFVNRWGCIGTAFVWAVSEITVMISAQSFVKKYVGYKINISSFVHRILLAIPLLVLCWYVNKTVVNLYASLAIVTFCCVVYFTMLEIIVLKNKLLIENLERILKKTSHSKEM